MGTKLLYVWILGILLIAAGFYMWSKTSYDNFQVLTCPVPAADVAKVRERFWKIVATRNTDTNVRESIFKVSYPDPDPSVLNNRLPVKFSNYISMYALARRSDISDTKGARADLFNCYNTLQSEMENNLFDREKGGPLNLETCKQLDILRAKYIVEYANMNKQMQDLSGTEITAEKMRDENLEFQKRVTEKCKTEPISQICMNLASQEMHVYDLLSKYDNANINLGMNAYDISDNLLLINQTYNLMGCSLPNQFFSTGKGLPVYWVDKNKRYLVEAGGCSQCPGDIPTKCGLPNIVPESFFSGLTTSTIPFSCLMPNTASKLEIKDTELPIIDTESLRTKLQNMSPYYLSPDVVDAITGSIQTDAASQLRTTPDILASLTNVIQNIKKFTNTP